MANGGPWLRLLRDGCIVVVETDVVELVMVVDVAVVEDDNGLDSCFCVPHGDVKDMHVEALEAMHKKSSSAEGSASISDRRGDDHEFTSCCCCVRRLLFFAISIAAPATIGSCDFLRNIAPLTGL